MVYQSAQNHIVLTCKDLESPMDDTNRKLLHLLGENARRPAAELARELGVSRATVQNRIDQLVQGGTIARFTIALGEEADETTVSAMVLLKLSGGDSRKTIARLRALPEVFALTSVNGEYDLILELRVPTLRHLDEVLADIRRLPLVTETNSSIRMKRFK